MILHCASRLGVISYLYNNRHDIAYRIGLRAEMPIAMCSGEYISIRASLVIMDANTTDKQMPVQFTHAKEIILFVQALYKSSPEKFNESECSHNTMLFEVAYTPPLLTIFHPPCEWA